VRSENRLESRRQRSYATHCVVGVVEEFGWRQAERLGKGLNGLRQNGVLANLLVVGRSAHPRTLEEFAEV
jgi:hypothetical protein